MFVERLESTDAVQCVAELKSAQREFAELFNGIFSDLEQLLSAGIVQQLRKRAAEGPEAGSSRPADCTNQVATADKS